MMRFLLLLLLALACAGCADIIIVVVERLEPGGGGMAIADGPALEVVVRIRNDATGFNPGDLMRLLVNGVDRTDEIQLSGTYGVLRIDPAPQGMQFVELFPRTGPVIDTFTWDVMPFAGPTLDSVVPTSAQTGTQVTMDGAGFSGGALRVFFGGVEGTVDAFSDTNITATVPSGALPGLVWVLVGTNAAEGVVDFQPLDATAAPVPAPTTKTIFAVFPGHGTTGTVVRIYGQVFSDLDDAVFNNADTDRLISVETVTLPVVGDVLSALVVIDAQTPSGAGEVFVRDLGTESNRLPFTVD